MATLDDFLKYAQEQVDNHSIYVWGAQGQNHTKITEKWIRSRENGTGGYDNGESYADAAVSFWKKQCAAGYTEKLRAFDCSGLFVYWLLDKKLIPKDKTANGLKGLCTITNTPKRGCWLFQVNSSGRATHIGLMITDTECIHAKGRKYGVVREKYRASYWDKIGIPKLFASEINTATDTPDVSGDDYTFARLLKYGCRGEDVKQLKAALLAKGYGGLTLTNGNFYGTTRGVVKKFQRENGLTVDGIVGANTYTALGVNYDL